jgi:glycolate oxidase subunit GlcD
MTIPDQVLNAARGVVGDEWVRTAPSELETYASDGLPTRRARPGAVVLPGSHEEVVRIVRILDHYQLPFVARGAGTGLSGGTLASDDAILIVLTRLNRILALDPENRRAVVEPGVVNVRLSAASARYGLHYAPDPSSQTACTIGGNVAENAGGPHCLKYGVTSNHVLELVIVLPDASVVTLGSPNGDTWGPDLVGLFVGSEGMFGIATRITVRLLPTPAAIRTLLADFLSIRAAGEAVSNIIASGILPAALEMMDQNCVKVVEASAYAAGYPTDAAAVLLVELDGPSEQAVDADADAVVQLLLHANAREVQRAHDTAHRARLWQGRKKAFGALGRISPNLVVQDAVVPRSVLPDVLERIDAIGRTYRLPVSNVFHAGDGNLHPNINYDRSEPDARDRVERACAAIMHVCIDAGGSITGEHGVGLDKLRYMASIFDADTLTAMRNVRRAFDPEERSNPGKVIPIHACREWWTARNLRTVPTEETVA